jgi:anti-sigma B factor antagonist
MGERSKLQIAEHRQGDVTVLTLSGEITLDDGDLAFGRYVDRMIAAGSRQIVVDLSGVTYIDSAGVGMLVAESKHVTQHGGAMRLARLTARSHHLLAMLKLKFVFEIYDEVEAAVRSFAWRPQ